MTVRSSVAALRPVARLARGFAAHFRPPRPLAATLDLADPEVAADPFPHYEALRSGGPVHYLARHDFWIVLGHAEAKAVFEQPRAFSSIGYDDVDAVLLAADPPDHTPIRRAVSRLFSSDALRRLTEFAAAEADALARDELDVVADYAVPLTRAVAARLLGFDVARVGAALDEARRVGAPFAAVMALLDELAPSASAYATFQQPEAGGFTQAQSRSLVRLLWLAATTTTERVIVNCALRLAQDPHLRARVAAEPSLLTAFIEEVMRLNPAEYLVRRVTAAPVALGGVELPAGATVQLCLAAVNRDPSVFEEPAELRLDRPAKLHLAFGHGLHFCPGATLARQLLPAAVGRLARSPRLALLEPLDRVPFEATLTACVPRRLRIAL